MPVVGPLETSYLTEKDIDTTADSLLYLVTLSTGNLDPLTEPGLPPIKSKHPWHQSALVDRYAIDQWIKPGIDCYVRVYYSSDGRFKFPNNTPQEVGFKKWSMQDTTRVVALPVLFERPVLKGCVNGSSSWTYQWFREDVQVTIAIGTVQRTVIVGSLTSADRAAIKAQYNKLHSLAPNGTGTEYFKFLGAQIEQIGKSTGDTSGKWQITYRWSSDPGNAAPQATDIPAQYQGSVILPPPRRPFFEYRVFFPTGNFDPCNQSSIAEPQILDVPTYDTRPIAQGGDVAPKGAVNLPGRPLDG